MSNCFTMETISLLRHGLSVVFFAGMNDGNLRGSTQTKDNSNEGKDNVRFSWITSLE